MVDVEKKKAPKRKEDRRKSPTPMISRYTFRGKRKASRRDLEKYNYYVDRLGKRVWTVIGTVMFLSILDSLFTLYFLNRGFQEINPVMNFALFISKPAFILIKYALTIIGILLIAIHKRFIFVKELMILIIVMYTLLNCYHIYLFFCK